MKKPIYSALLVALIAAPFIALGGFVREVTPLDSTTAAPARPVVTSGQRMVGEARLVVGHVEQAHWLLLTSEASIHPSSSAPHHQVVSVAVWSL
ncbi:hypothetical protein ACSDBR_08335 [Acidithiobacillus ferriphilus]|uniref:hypothetical protein n=1 Tax=Acidithiobacillus TaxID=119977 RepID=UPI001C06C42C|nr:MULTISPECIES: hypothetical protein [Acidithiobacillus]MBU2848289.1 hypothetical protein [Acidithiobacillus ferriphilus]MDA8246561.1 hypothetical protein [Acidithiobacillus sp.]